MSPNPGDLTVQREPGGDNQIVSTAQRIMTCEQCHELQMH